MFLAYFIIYIATIFLGNISAFAAFWIVFRGVLGFWGVPFLIVAIFAANVSGDLLWYSLGRALRDTRFGNFVKNHLPRHEKIERAVQKNGTSWMITAKFLYASSLPVIFSIGWAKIGFRKFIRTSLLSVAIWLPILSGLSYGLFSGLSPLLAVSIFKKFEVALIIGLALFITADYFLAKLFRKILGSNGNGNGATNGSASEPPGDEISATK
jgi:membrane protein DedA with SNARE-associated domain